MIYTLFEMQRAALAPLRIAAEGHLSVLRNPLNPVAWTPGGRVAAAALDLFEHTTRPYGKPDFNLPFAVVAGDEVAVHEEVVLRRPFGQLRRFRREGCDKRKDPKVLLVAPHSGHFATLLRGTVEALLSDHDVYIAEWRDARMVPLSEGAFSLDDYIDYVIDDLRFLGADTHVIAVCQPAVPVLCAVALMAAGDDAAQPRSMTLMGGPIDTRINPTVPCRLAQDRPLDWFRHTVISPVPAIHPGFMRQVYPGFLQLTGFMQMNLDRHVNAHLELFEHLVAGDGEEAQKRKDFYEEYRAVMDLPADYYLETVRKVFQEFHLPRGIFESRGRRVDPALIRRTALMTVEGEKDDISSPGQTRAAQDLCTALKPGQREHWLQDGVGHYGVFNGRRWRESIAPKVKAFIRRHDRKHETGKAAA